MHSAIASASGNTSRPIRSYLDRDLIGVGEQGRFHRRKGFVWIGCEAGGVAPHDEAWTVVRHKLNLPGAIGRREGVGQNHLHAPTGSHAAQLPYPLSSVAMSRNNRLAQLEWRGAQDGAVHGTDV